MNFEQIKTFISVAETGNFSMSVKQRFLSQPTISNQIRQLEEELGIKLFERNSQKVILTDAGSHFYKYANKLLAVERDIYRNISEKEEKQYGIVSVGAPSFQTEKMLNRFFLCVCKRYGSKMSCRIMDRKDKDIPALVRDGELELGISSIRLQGDNLLYQPVFVEKFVLVTPNEPEFRGLDKDQLGNLVKIKNYIDCEHKAGGDRLWDNVYESYVSKIISEGKSYSCCPNFDMQLSAIEAGAGIGFMPNTFVRDAMKRKTVLCYPYEELMERQLYVIYDKEREKSTDIIRDIKDLLIEEMAEGAE